MNSGKYVFAQVLCFVNRYEFDKIEKSIRAIIEFENLIAGINLFYLLNVLERVIKTLKKSIIWFDIKSILPTI